MVVYRCTWGWGAEGEGAPELVVQKGTALSEGQAEERRGGHWIEVGVRVQHQAATVRESEEIP